MNESLHSLRRQQIIACADLCDDSRSRTDILIDKIIELQDTLFELQQAYTELLISYRGLSSCAPHPF